MIKTFREKPHNCSPEDNVIKTVIFECMPRSYYHMVKSHDFLGKVKLASLMQMIYLDDRKPKMSVYIVSDTGEKNEQATSQPEDQTDI